jgi:hypothetical protein
MVETVACYGCAAWKIKEVGKYKLLSMEMDCNYEKLSSMDRI